MAVEFVLEYFRARNFLPMTSVKQNVVARSFLGAKGAAWLGRRLRTSENASLEQRIGEKLYMGSSRET